MLACGYERLRAYEQTLVDDYARLRARPLAFRLAYAAGFETGALAIGHMLVRHRAFFFRDADPSVSSLVLWHFVEEVEHKRAAFGVYRAVFGPMAGVRGLAFGGGPFGGDVTLNNLMYVCGWPPMIGVHLMLPLFFWGALGRLREMR